MGMSIHHSDQAMGTLGGTVIAFIGIVDGSDILKTGIRACVGAIVSFTVSKGMNKLWPPEKPKDQGKVEIKVETKVEIKVETKVEIKVETKVEIKVELRKVLVICMGQAPDSGSGPFLCNRY